MMIFIVPFNTQSYCVPIDVLVVFFVCNVPSQNDYRLLYKILYLN